MKIASIGLIAVALLTSTASFAQYSWDSTNPNGPQPGFDSQPYRGSSGAQYQYDLSKPVDQTRYGVDPRAQLRDQMNVDPRRELDRDLGQRGGGIRR